MKVEVGNYSTVSEISEAHLQTYRLRWRPILKSINLPGKLGSFQSQKKKERFVEVRNEGLRWMSFGYPRKDHRTWVCGFNVVIT